MRGTVLTSLEDKVYLVGVINKKGAQQGGPFSFCQGVHKAFDLVYSHLGIG